jgi:hypothetical protein
MMDATTRRLLPAFWDPLRLALRARIDAYNAETHTNPQSIYYEQGPHIELPGGHFEGNRSFARRQLPPDAQVEIWIVETEAGGAALWWGADPRDGPEEVAELRLEAGALRCYLGDPPRAVETAGLVNRILGPLLL